MCGERGVGLLLLGGYFRFIPARAGNGVPQAPPMFRGSVHPRACGERKCSRMSLATAIGSSPRVRGTVERFGHRLVLRRFIPARAGNGCALAFSPRRCSVHPRACGERSLPEVGGHAAQDLGAAAAKRLALTGRGSTVFGSKRFRKEQCRPERRSARSINVCERMDEPWRLPAEVMCRVQREKTWYSGQRGCILSPCQGQNGNPGSNRSSSFTRPWR